MIEFVVADVRGRKVGEVNENPTISDFIEIEKKRVEKQGDWRSEDQGSHLLWFSSPGIAKHIRVGTATFSLSVRSTLCGILASHPFGSWGADSCIKHPWANFGGLGIVGRCNSVVRQREGLTYTCIGLSLPACHWHTEDQKAIWPPVVEGKVIS